MDGFTKIAVLGLGPSLSLYDPDEYDLAIGVNDIWRFHKTEVVVCVDHAKVFKPDRLKVINECTPTAFYSQVVNWDFKEGFRKIELMMKYPDSGVNLNAQAFEKSFCSPFVAVQIAYRYYSADEIHLFGVDMTHHPHLDAKLCGRIAGHFRHLKAAMSRDRVNLIIHGDGILKNI